MALRLAGRDARRHRGRSGLILTLIALPVAAMTLIVLLLASMQPTAQDRIDADLGTAQAYLTEFRLGDAAAVQDPTNPMSGHHLNETDPDFVPKDPATVVPAGYTVIEEYSSQAFLTKGKLEIGTRIIGSDLFNPAFESRFSLIEGSREREDDAVYLSPSLQSRLGLEVGDTVSVESHSYQVAGIIREESEMSQVETIFTTADHPLVMTSENAQIRLYLLGDEPLTWAEIKRLNAQGVGALSRAVLLDPPHVPGMQGLKQGQDRQMITAILGISVVGVLVLAEVGLLAGAAFAVGAKKQRRMLALLAAAGGEQSTVRSVVTATGVVLGTIGASVGVLGGVGVAAAIVHWYLGKHSPVFAGFHVVIWPLVIFALLGFAAAVIAAAVPARAISKQDVYRSLKSAQAASHQQTRIPVAGLVLVVLALLTGGAGVAVILGLDNPDQYGPKAIVFVPLMAGGTLLLLLGLLLCTGWIIGTMARFAGRLPVATRLAVRDASRNRSRSVPSIAAVLAATALASIVMVSAATLAHEETSKRQVGLNDNQGAVSLTVYDAKGNPVSTVEPQSIVDAVETVLGRVEATTVISGVDDACTPNKPCTMRQFVLPEENTCHAKKERNVGDIWSCINPSNDGGSAFPLLTVGGEEALTAMLGHEPEQETLQALEDGNMVVLDPAWIIDGHVTVESRTYQHETDDDVALSSFTMPAVAAEPAEQLSVGGVISAETAKEHGFTVTQQTLIMDLPSQPTQAEADAINLELEAGSWFTFRAPGPPTEAILWAIAGIAGLVALTAASVTAGLALADSRADQMTLAGIGAAPRLRKAMAAAQTALTAVAGVGLGLAAGLLPAVALFGSAREYVLVVPWTQLGALLILVPLAGAAAAWLFTRTRVPMTRRALLP